jgi:tetratricopeptide (TPR) repeat protein
LPIEQSGRPPFIGREKEMEQLLGILKDVMLQEGTLVLLAGEAGIGKTRLVEEFEQKAAYVDCISLVGRCIPGLPSPFLPFIEAFGQYFRPSGGVLPNRTEESLFGRIDDSQNSWPIDKILFSTLEFVRRKSALRPMIIRIEDLHWADSASVQLLHFLARNAKGLKLLLIGTYRPEDLFSDKSGSAHPFVDTLRIMHREGLCHDIALGEMDPPDVQNIVDGILGGPLESKVLEKVIEESEGNPLYAIETTKLLALSESISYSDGKWRAAGHIDISIPQTVKEVILRRLERVEKQDRRLLEFASVVGRDFNIDILEEVTRSNKMELLENLDTIEREGRLICHQEQSYHFSHETIRQVTYDSISKPRRKEIHRIIGEALERTVYKAPPALLAMHFRMGGEKLKCVKYSLQAGENSVAKGAAIDAVPLLEQVIQCAGSDPSCQGEVIKAYDSLGMANLLLGRLEKAVESLNIVVSRMGLENASSKTLFNLAECWSGVALGKGDQTKSLTYLDMAEKAAKGNQYEIGRIAGFRATASLWKGDFSGAETNFRTAINSMIQAKDIENVIRYKSYLSDAFLTQGKMEESLEELQDALELVKVTPGFYGELEANFYAGTVHLHIGNVKEAIQHLKRSVKIAMQIGESSAICHGYTYLCLAWEMLEDKEEALAAARLSYENAQGTESPFIMLNGISGLLHMLVRMNKVEEAEQLNEKALILQKDFNWSMHSTTRCLLTAAMAEFCAIKGEWSKSDQLFLQSFGLMIGTPSGLLLEALSRTWFAGSLLKRDRVDDAVEQLNLSLDICSRLHNAFQIDVARKILATVTKG